MEVFCFDKFQLAQNIFIVLNCIVSLVELVCSSSLAEVGFDGPLSISGHSMLVHIAGVNNFICPCIVEKYLILFKILKTNEV